MHCVWNAAQIFKSNIPLHGVAHLTSTEFHFSELLPIWLLLICQGYAHVTRLRPAYILNLSSFEGCRNPLTVIPFFFFLKAWVCSQSWGLRLHMSDIWLVFILIKIIINKKSLEVGRGSAILCVFQESRHGRRENILSLVSSGKPGAPCLGQCSPT